jgi:RNA ligase (TIGR02306 family)
MEIANNEIEAVAAAEVAAAEPQPTVAVIGQIAAVEPIADADRIQLAVADCGEHGTWRGVVPKSMEPGEKVLVLLQDALLPADPENARWGFMSKHKFRVRMARFRGCPSECVILETVGEERDEPVGTDVGVALGITKHSKPIPATMVGKAKGNFPSFLEKTDEPNFQRYRERDEATAGAWYATVKYDGTSCTSFVRDNVLRVCSRNLELEPGEGVYWQMAEKYQLQRVAEGLALQFEIIGPGIQGNPLGLAECEIRVFTLYDVANRCKAPLAHLKGLCDQLGLPMAEIVHLGNGPISDDELRALADIKYPNGRPGEGVVIRDLDSRFSFKAINLSYKD